MGNSMTVRDRTVCLHKESQNACRPRTGVMYTAGDNKMCLVTSFQMVYPIMSTHSNSSNDFVFSVSSHTFTELVLGIFKIHLCKRLSVYDVAGKHINGHCN